MGLDKRFALGELFVLVSFLIYLALIVESYPVNLLNPVNLLTAWKSVFLLAVIFILPFLSFYLVHINASWSNFFKVVIPTALLIFVVLLAMAWNDCAGGCWGRIIVPILMCILFVISIAVFAIFRKIRIRFDDNWNKVLKTIFFIYVIIFFISITVYYADAPSCGTTLHSAEVFHTSNVMCLANKAYEANDDSLCDKSTDPRNCRLNAVWVAQNIKNNPALASARGIPVVSNIPDFTSSEIPFRESFDLDDYVYDSDNSDSELNWAISNSGYFNISIDPVTHIVTIDTGTAIGWSRITFTATDPDGNKGSDDMILDIGTQLTN